MRRSLNEIDTFFVDDLQLETIEDWNKRNSNKSKRSNKLTNLNENSAIEQDTDDNKVEKQLNENKDELIERLSLAASTELNKKNGKSNFNLFYSLVLFVCFSK